MTKVPNETLFFGAIFIFFLGMLALLPFVAQTITVAAFIWIALVVTGWTYKWFVTKDNTKSSGKSFIDEHETETRTDIQIRLDDALFEAINKRSKRKIRVMSKYELLHHIKKINNRLADEADEMSFEKRAKLIRRRSKMRLRLAEIEFSQ